MMEKKIGVESYRKIVDNKAITKALADLNEAVGDRVILDSRKNACIRHSL